ncbi:hypothetical protein N0V83_008952 [Neocucurbitaria cava]|uniref:Uncharacterized protein n=1 Tax=Neocucurbitaria cava TaxID=798079 RepID=A0A9W8Y2F8_9PLEO|nr:hypothetical protein N0V83_008952 [Neocucurbitaria cava]
MRPAGSSKLTNKNTYPLAQSTAAFAGDRDATGGLKSHNQAGGNKKRRGGQGGQKKKAKRAAAAAEAEAEASNRPPSPSGNAAA